MTSSLGGSIRRCRGLTDIVPQYDDSQSDKSQISSGSGESDHKNGSGSIKIQHLTGSCALGRSRFPKLEECAHFHYEHVELGSLQISLYEEEDLKSLSSLEYNENSENKWLTVKVSSQGQSWLLRRTYENFRMLDQQLHQCIYDRKFSSLPELPPLENLPDKENPQAYIKNHLSKYCERFSEIAGSLINCGPVLSWLQLDNRGRRILVTDGDNCPINTPAVAAAYAVKKYQAVAADEISFDIGDMISVIDMPPPEDSIWWRGKRGFMVGFFPSQCVAVITDKVPRNLQLNQPSTIIEPSKPVLRKHGKLIAFFRAFILSRPSKRHLKQSGILKERVFGCDLGEHLLNSGRDVPMVLKCCSDFIERYGIVDGIYRLSGATSNIQKLRTTFDEDRIPTLYNDDSILQDIHSVASLLKMYFRELPNPLCTYQLYKHFVNAVQNADPAERVASMREVVQKLPPPHFRTLEFLMRHLSKVAEHGTRTGMTARNIAIVWAPNLLRCKELEFGGVAALQGVGVQAVVTEFLISNVDLVFCNDHISFHGTAKRIRPKSLSLGTPTKLLSLEEAQSKRLGLEHSHENYIEVGGGPSCLPKIYHTVIELPTRKRIPLKRSPMGWKSFFSRSSGGTSLRKSSSTNSGKRKTSIPNEITYKMTDSLKKKDTEAKTRLRTVKSAESLTSGVGNGSSVRNSMCLEYLSPPSPKHCGTSGHSRSVSHDSYFDHLSENTPMHSTLRDDDKGLSDLQVNFDLDESEMKIFSEESSQLFSNTSSSEQLQPNMKKVPILASAENTIIVDPSPKKHKTSCDNSSCSSATLSDDMTAVSNKRSRLEERLFDEDLAYIDSQCTDRLVVEVDVHHRETSQISSPMTDTAYSENENGCTVSDTTITNINVPYTPLSECSCTTSSNFEFSYQRLSSSMSSSQLPRSSTDSMKTNDGKKYENIPGNRLSYQGELRTGVPIKNNRLSLQTLTPGVEGDHFDSTKTTAVGQNEIKSTDKAFNKNVCESKMYRNSCDSNYSKDVFNDQVNGTLHEDDEWKSDKCDENQADCHSYENVQKPKLVLDDREMFSDSKNIEACNDSPYELVTMVGNRMTSVSSNDIIVPRDNNVMTDSNYEEIQPVCTARCLNNVDHHSEDDNYEKMSSSAYSENDLYSYEGSVRDKTKSNYEEISILGDDLASMRDLSSSNESLESSADEAMVENNLYESLVADDSSPDQAAKKFSVAKETEIVADNKENQNVNDYKNFVMIVESPEKENTQETISNDEHPLLISENPSPYSDSEPLFDKSEPLNDEQNSEQISSKENDLDKNDIPMKNDNLETNSIRPNTLIIPNENDNSESTKEPDSNENFPNNENTPEEIKSNKNGEIEMKNNLSSGCTKSVQDLVSRFEWSAENDFLNGRKDVTQRNKSLSPDYHEDKYPSSRKEYFSLPPVLVKRKPSGDSSSTMQPSDEKDDQTVRDRIEKYKEERRLALRQKYQVDGDINDQKDEEMIRRIKHKIQKNDRNSHDFDSSPSDDASSINSELVAKDKPAAVTTISILYTSRRKRDSVDVDKLEKSNSDTKDLNNDGSPKRTEDVSLRCKLITNNICGKNDKSFKPGSLSKSYSTDRIEPVREWSLKQNACDVKKPFTASLERKIKNSGNVESLVAKRVNQLSEASESSEISRLRRSGEIGSMRQRAHSTSGPVAPYCIRDIAAIFETKDNNK
ncbi:GTPase-activating protein CdGAPr isoform X2 [Planococcus citri]|uniref:GTPase-activating protein CdGAPr isoform X2 n=1 Tax=Planococcus citri TaxID=170843 RepID=UPI0031F8881D